MQLRPYQIEISKKALSLLLNFKIAYLAMKPRTGKTITALQTAAMYGAKKLLFVTKKKAIKSIESDAKFYPELDVVVINYESVLKKMDDYDLIIIDEAHSCFLGNTLVGGIKIKDIKIGDVQKSYNFEKSIYEYKKVIRVFKNVLKEDLIKIKCNGKEIICTKSHKIYTKRGWVKSGDILSSDELQILQ